MPPPPDPSRAWCFTQNNPTPDDLRRLTELREGWNFIAYQLERVTTLHVQGYVVFNRPHRLGGARTALGLSAPHLEPRGGTHADALTYVTKADTRVADTQPTILGTAPVGAGTRSDLARVADDIATGSTERDVAARHGTTYIRYARGIARAIAIRRVGRRQSTAPRVLVYYGVSGAGKSRAAYDEFPDAYWITTGDRGKTWWAHYTGQLVAVWDDFKGELPYRVLLRMLDRYNFYVEEKGASHPLAVVTWVFTSNHHPEEWYDYLGKGHHMPALQRRITELVEFETTALGTVRKIRTWV